MRSINSTFKTEKNKAANRPVRLYTVENIDGASTNLNFAEWDVDVTFAGVTYTRFPVTLDSISENNKGAVDSVQITLCNISRLIQAYLEQYDFRGKKVTIRTVWADQLADASAYIDDIYYIDSYAANQDSVTINLTSKFDVLQVELPLRRYSRNYCHWIFKGTECGYAGANSTCTKTKQDCKVNKNNYVRFGGFPSIKQQRVFLG